LDNNVLQLIGIRIRHIRKEMNLSQEALGEKGGFHFSYIGQIERGEKNITILNLTKIADALEVKLGQLFTYVNEEEKLVQSDGDIKEILSILRKLKPHQVKTVRSIVKSISDDSENK